MKNYFQRVIPVGILLLTLVILLLLSSCDDDDNVTPAPEFTFKQIGLDNLKVYELFLLGDDSLFAATSDGVYVKKLGSADAFVQIGYELCHKLNTL